MNDYPSSPLGWVRKLPPPLKRLVGAPTGENEVHLAVDFLLAHETTLRGELERLGGRVVQARYWDTDGRLVVVLPAGAALRLARLDYVYALTLCLDFED